MFNKFKNSIAFSGCSEVLEIAIIEPVVEPLVIWVSIIGDATTSYPRSFDHNPSAYGCPSALVTNLLTALSSLAVAESAFIYPAS